MEKEYVRKPHKLLDYLLATYRLKNDSTLAAHLQVKRPTLSKIRGGTLAVGANFILAVHDAFDIPIKEIKALAQASDES
jgi:plasmid maintenance system antidote protein VapI